MTAFVRRHILAMLSLRRPAVLAAFLAVAAFSSAPGVPGLAPMRALANGAVKAVPTGPQLLAVSASLGARTTTLVIEASDPVAYVMSQPDPYTVLVDLRNARTTGATNNVKTRFGHVASVALEEGTMADGVASARVRVRLTDAAPYNVRSARNIIVVEIGKTTAPPVPVIETGSTIPSAVEIGKTTPPAAVASVAGSSRTNAAQGVSGPATVRPGASSISAVAPASLLAGAAPSKGGVAKATQLNAVRTSLEVQGTVLTLIGNGQLVAANVEELGDAQPRVAIDFPNVAPWLAPSSTEVRKGPIDRVHIAVASQSPPVTRVVVDLNRRTSYWVQPPEDDSTEFRIVFDNTPIAATDAPIFAAQIGKPRPPAPLDPMTALTLRVPPSEPATGSQNPPNLASAPSTATATVVSPPPPASVPPGIGLFGTTAMTQAAPPPGQTPVASAQTPPPPAPAPTVRIGTPSDRGQQIGQSRTFTGHPVTLDFQGADLRAVLRTFNEISGLNIVIDPTIQGTVDVALRDVPWDQALDIILRANKLDWEADGTIIRIAPVSVLAAEKEEQRKLADAQRLAGDLAVRSFTLSYAKALDMETLVKRAALSERGEVQRDERTNTLIIRDLPARLQTAADLIGTLDRAQPQVEIEARIVQTTREFARSLGVQWGFNGRVSQALGNTTGLAFPNQGSLSGRTGVSQGISGGEPIDHASTIVNLGVEGASNAIGLALGSVNGALNLDVALSALERSGQGRLLSTPRVSTQNNIEAEITQGVQIPIQTVANNTVTVTFKDAALTLKVTPQITAANTVIMRISVENASPDFSRSIKDIPPIDTQRAITQVLVSDGQTTVIGGIYVSREQAAEDRTPGLHRLPLLGWLFKRESIRDESRELLIFITPRIIKT